MTEVDRDLERERSIGRQLVHTRPLARAWARLVTLAEERAHDGPIRLPPGRSMVTEVREEIADARNYVLWGVEVGEVKPLTAAKVCAHLAAIAALLAGSGD